MRGALNIEIEGVNGHDRSEALAQAFDSDDRLAHRPVLTVVHSRVRSRTCSALPAVME